MNISTQLGLRWLMLWGMLYLAGCSLFRGSNEEIISLSTRLDRNHAIHFNAAGVTHYQAGHLPLALVSFENALSHDATFGPAHNNMGRVFFDKSDLFQAAMSFEKAMQLMPGDPAPINNLGLVFESAGRTVEAIELYQTAHQINPTCAEYLGNLVRARIRLGERDESISEQLRQLLFIDTRPDWIDWADEMLALDLNPMLDRGPAGPDFSQLDAEPRDDRNDNPVFPPPQPYDATPPMEYQYGPVPRPPQPGLELSPLQPLPARPGTEPQPIQPSPYAPPQPQSRIDGREYIAPLQSVPSSPRLMTPQSPVPQHALPLEPQPTPIRSRPVTSIQSADLGSARISSEGAGQKEWTSPAPQGSHRTPGTPTGTTSSWRPSAGSEQVVPATFHAPHVLSPLTPSAH